MKNSDWDLDYRHGVDGEKTVAHLLSIETDRKSTRLNSSH